MLNFIISFLILSVSLFLAIIAVRYGSQGIFRLDVYLSTKTSSTFNGFQRYFRFPTTIGIYPEYLFSLILGSRNYFNNKIWPLRATAFVSVFLFLAILKSRSMVMDYYSLTMIKSGGFSSLFTSGNLIIFLNIISIAYLAIFVMISIESIRMFGRYGPLRILSYSFLCLIMANLTLFMLALALFIIVIYVVIKIIGFFFFSGKSSRKDHDDDDSITDVVNTGYQPFKSGLLEWEEQNKETHTVTTKSTKKSVRPVITRKKRKKTLPEDDIPRLHPD